MRARAPGKLVLSGAYAVLEGAPALVAAVDRYVEADAGRPAAFEPPEVLEAKRRGAIAAVPWFDATALRDGDRKLGLGSSAAILAACLGAAGFDAISDDDLPSAVFPVALASHRAAQGGGSGIDVAAACFGGVIRCALTGDDLEVVPHRLPEGLSVRVFACGRAASTREMLEAVRAFAARDRSGHAEILAEAGRGARAAAEAETAEALVEALRTQHAALAALGRAADAPIVTDEIAELDRRAFAEAACFLPSGAGGGDVAVHYGPAEPSPGFVRAAGEAGLTPVPMAIGAQGLHRGHP